MDELLSDRYYQMSLVELQEALARLAEKTIGTKYSLLYQRVITPGRTRTPERSL